MKRFVTVLPKSPSAVSLLPNSLKVPVTSPSFSSLSSSPLSSLSPTPAIINVFTDGSCIQSGKKKADRPAGFACVFPEYPAFNFAAKLVGTEKTNNRAEFMACITAMKIANKIDTSSEKILYVYTDSELLIKSLTLWLPGWKAKNWKKADNTPVKNVDCLLYTSDAADDM
jgi:ribonuclease HI